MDWNDTEGLYRWMNGLDIPTVYAQAEHMIEQMFMGLHVCEANRKQVLDYLIMHLQEAEARGRSSHGD